MAVTTTAAASTHTPAGMKLIRQRCGEEIDKNLDGIGMLARKGKGIDVRTNVVDDSREADTRTTTCPLVDDTEVNGLDMGTTHTFFWFFHF